MSNIELHLEEKKKLFMKKDTILNNVSQASAFKQQLLCQGHTNFDTLFSSITANIEKVSRLQSAPRHDEVPHRFNRTTQNATLPASSNQLSTPLEQQQHDVFCDDPKLTSLSQASLSHEGDESDDSTGSNGVPIEYVPDECIKRIPSQQHTCTPFHNCQRPFGYNYRKQKYQQKPFNKYFPFSHDKRNKMNTVSNRRTMKNWKKETTTNQQKQQHFEMQQQASQQKEQAKPQPSPPTTTPLLPLIQLSPVQQQQQQQQQYQGYYQYSMQQSWQRPWQQQYYLQPFNGMAPPMKHQYAATPLSQGTSGYCVAPSQNFAAQFSQQPRQYFSSPPGEQRLPRPDCMPPFRNGFRHPVYPNDPQLVPMDMPSQGPMCGANPHGGGYCGSAAPPPNFVPPPTLGQALPQMTPASQRAMLQYLLQLDKSQQM